MGDIEESRRGDAAEDRPPVALAAIARLAIVQPILEVCLTVTGMGYGVVARVTDDRWVACAVLDRVDFGLEPGGELPIQTTLCNVVRQRRAPLAFDHASADPSWRHHNTPKLYGLESYIAVPILLEDGEFFGTLCAIDPHPAPASNPSNIKMFELFAQLIGSQLSKDRALTASQVALTDAETGAELRDQFIAVLGHDLRNPLASIEAAAKLLERRASGPDVPRILSEMMRAAGRMERLINDVLDFARGRLGGGLVALRRPVELEEVLTQVVVELQLAHPDRLIVSESRSTVLLIATPIAWRNLRPTFWPMVCSMGSGRRLCA